MKDIFITHTTIMQPHYKTSSYSGFTLIEVMLAVFILTVCLLGFTGVYINVLKNTQNNYQTSVKNLSIADQKFQ